MKENIIILQFILLFLIQNTYGQSKKNNQIGIDNKLQHQIGLSVNGTGDYGAIYYLSYKLYKNRTGIKLNIYPFLSNYLNESSFGATFLYKLYNGNRINIIFYQNNNYLISNEDVTKYFYPSGYFNNGLGGGIDYIFKTDCSLSLIIGGSYYQNFDRIVPSFELGFYYKL